MRSDTESYRAQVPALTYQPAGGSDPVVENVPAIESIVLPADVLRAARLCTRKLQKWNSAGALNGVFVHRTDDGFVRVVASDGGRLLVANVFRLFADRMGPEWLEKGVIIPAEQLDARLALIDKNGGSCRLGFAVGSPFVELSNESGSVAFRLSPIQTEYPGYDKVMHGWGGAFGENERAEFRPTAFDVKHFKQVGDVATRLGAPTVHAYASPDVTKGKTTSPGPVVFVFGKGVALFVNPQPTTGAMTTPDRILLAPAIKATISALKAHETRNRKAAKKLTGKLQAQALETADNFKARIEALISRTGDGSVPAALPAPVPPPPPAINDAVSDDAQVGDEGPTAEQLAAVDQPEVPPAPQPEEPAVAPKVVERQGARGARRKAKARKAKR